MLVQRCRESEVDELELKVRCQHDVLWFEVTMTDLFVVTVFECADHLVEVISCERLLEGTRTGNKVEEVLMQELTCHIRHTSLASIFIFDIFSDLRVVELHDVGVVHRLKSVYLDQDQLLCLRVQVIIHDLDGSLPAIFSVKTQVHLAGASMAELADDDPIAKYTLARLLVLLI